MARVDAKSIPNPPIVARNDMYSCSYLIDVKHFTISDIDYLKQVFLRAGIDEKSISFQFVQRTDLEGLPYMLYAFAKVNIEGDDDD